MLKRLAEAFGYDLVRRDRQLRLDSHLAVLLPALDIDLIIDVGANTGQYAARLRRNGYRGEILSYEPLSAMQPVLQRAARADGRWIIRDCALGAEPGHATIRMSPDSSWSSLRGFTDWGRARFPSQDRDAEPEEISVVRLDADLPAQMPDWETRKIFLKLDTQGFDQEAFAGAEGVMSAIQALQAEVPFLSIYDGAPRYAEAMAAFEAAGFETTGLFPVKRDRKTHRMIEMDCVMRRM
jgi:FkbM family methyltransferase